MSNRLKASLPPTGLRVSVVGCSGSGKTTLARVIAEHYGMAHVELDSLYHQPNWKPQERSLLLEQVRALTPVDGSWSVCGNYNSAVGEDLRSRANLIIFLDLPRRVVMGRIIRRSFRRAWTKEELWNGNRERWRNLLHPNPQSNIVFYAAVFWGKFRKRYRACMQSGEWRHAQVVHLKSAAEVDEFTRSLATQTSREKEARVGKG